MNNDVLSVLNTLISSGNNPQQVVNNMIMQNPQYQMLFNQVRSSGLSMKDYVLQYARQNNINLQPVFNFLNQKGIKL